jgi:hypothetical protein
MTVALDAIAADETRLDALANLPAEALRPLRESGVLDRTYADTIENVVGTVETLAEKTFHELVPNADVLLRGRGKIFQRPNDFADLYRDHLQRDIRLDLADSWADVEAVWRPVTSSPTTTASWITNTSLLRLRALCGKDSDCEWTTTSPDGPWISPSGSVSH